MKKDILLTNIIKDRFVYEGTEYVVLSNSMFEDEKNLLMLGRVDQESGYIYVVPKYSHNYVINYYKHLRGLFDLGENEND